MASGAGGYFAEPIDFPALGVCICAVARHARAWVALMERMVKVKESLENEQTVSTLVGILMERFRLGRAEAYARLRRCSRAERRKLVELPGEPLANTEELGRTMRAFRDERSDSRVQNTSAMRMNKQGCLNWISPACLN